jgi:hypothetical protein
MKTIRRLLAFCRALVVHDDADMTFDFSEHEIPRINDYMKSAMSLALAINWNEISSFNMHKFLFDSLA